MKLCAACLLGFNCRYDGGTNITPASSKLLEEYKKGLLIPVCPEQLGGLPTPRQPCEMECPGEDVLDGKCRVVSHRGSDFTQNFIRGAEEVLVQAKLLKSDTFIGVPRSPSCGCGKIYDGTFRRRLVKGDGVTTALLKRNGIKVILE